MGSSPLLNGIFWDLGQGNYFQHLQLETDPENVKTNLVGGNLVAICNALSLSTAQWEEK